MLRNWQCEVLSCEENGLTFHLSLSTGFRHAPVRLHRTTSAAFGQLRRGCGQSISEIRPVYTGVKIKEAFYSIEFWMMFNIVSRSMPSSTEREYEKSCVVQVAR